MGLRNDARVVAETLGRLPELASFAIEGIGLILSFCRAFPARTVNQACLKIVVSRFECGSRHREEAL
jgi:hypothetical protein